MRVFILLILAFSQIPNDNDNVTQIHNRALAIVVKTYKLDKSNLKIESLTSVNWPDSSLGCPVPGQVYFQVITPGHRVAIRSENKVYSVHLSEDSGFVCDLGRPVRLNRVNKDKKPSDPKLIIANKARGELAARLGISASDILLQSVSEKTWQDSSLGCRKMNQKYINRSFTGYVVTFSYEGKFHTYHTDARRVIYCTE